MNNFADWTFIVQVPDEDIPGHEEFRLLIIHYFLVYGLSQIAHM